MRDLTPQPGPGHRNHFPDIDEWMASLDLGPDAMAWDIGVHEAHCIRNLARLYPCHIYGFEPQDVLYAPAIEEFAALPNVRLFNFALGERTGDFPMCQAGSSSCSFIGGEVAEEPFIGRMVDVAEFMEQEDIRQVDFCMMNCEGYGLIPHPSPSGPGAAEALPEPLDPVAYGVEQGTRATVDLARGFAGLPYPQDR